ncbi:MAG: ATP-binding protein [Kiritimatiellia bacterium]
MNPNRPLSRTMRIGISPDYSGQQLQRRGDDRSEAIVSGEGTNQEFTEARSRSPEYDQLLESIYDAVLIADATGRIIDANRRAVDFFLRDVESLRGLSVIDLISGADASLLTTVLKNLASYRFTMIEGYCRRQDGSLFPAEIAVDKLALAGAERLCFFVRDVSVRKKAQDDLEKAVKRLEELDRARAQLVSNVSHELRTPLTSMIYAVSNLLRGVLGPLPERVRSYLEMLDGDCKRMLGTVNDVLDLHRIESNTLVLQKAKTPLVRLVHSSVEALRLQAERKSLALEMVPPRRRWFVKGDPQKLERVFINVLGNAIKFTPPGGRVHVSLEDSVDDAKRVLIAIEDTGIGIPPEAIPQVTLRYFTVGEQPSGAGLGLAIAKEILDLHGGTLDIKSPPPGVTQGTRVTIGLPIIDPPLVLVVEDHEGTRRVIEQQLRSEGYRVTAIEDGARVCDLARKERPEAIILDLMLPGIEGTDVILTLKGDKELMRIPIIVVSGILLSEARAKLLKSFSIPIFSKPWDETDLLELLAGSIMGNAPFERVASVAVAREGVVE